MEFVRTLNQVQYSEADLYGVRACDLSLLLSERIATPPTFVLTTKAWEAFVKKNNIQYKIDFILKQTDVKNERTLQNAYTTIRKLILAHPVPQEVVNEVAEAYESLGLGAGLDEMMKEDNSPYVLMLSSPTYAAEAESFEGIIQNVRTMEQVLLGLRELFAMSYTPEAILYRHQLCEKNVRLGIIIQSMPASMASATAYSTDPEHQELVFVHAYKGYTDLRDLVAKDFFHVKKEFLNVVSSQVVEQSKVIVRNEDGHLSPEEFTGRDQTLNDKQIMEVGRLAKKAEKALASPVKLFFSITKNDEYLVLFANRYAVAQKAREQLIAQKPVDESPSGFRQDINTGIITATGAAAAASTVEAKDEQPSEPAPVQEVEPEVVEYDKYDSEDDDQEDVEDYYEESPEQEAVEEEPALEEDDDKEEEVFADDDVLGAASDEELEDETQEFVQEEVHEEDEPEREDENVEYEDDSEKDDDGEEYEEDLELTANEPTSSDEQEEAQEDDHDDPKEDEVEYEDDSEEDDTEYEDDSEESQEETDAEEEVTEYEDDSEEDDTEGEDDHTEYEDDSEEEDDDKEEYEEGAEETQDEPEHDDEQEEQQQHVVADERSLSEPVVDDQKEVRDMLNKSFRIIYSELVKRYEKGGVQAPDTITELIQKGLQKQLFHVDGLSELLAIKRKARTDDPITEEEKALVLSVLNDLVE